MLRRLPGRRASLGDRRRDRRAVPPHRRRARRSGEGERLTLGCAIAFGVQIVVLGAFADRLRPIRAHHGPARGGRRCLPSRRRSSPAWARFDGDGAAGGACSPGSPARRWRFEPAGVGPAPGRSDAARRCILLLEPVFAGILGYCDRRAASAAPGSLGAALILAGIVVAELRARARPARTRPRTPTLTDRSSGWRRMPPVYEPIPETSPAAAFAPWDRRELPGPVRRRGVGPPGRQLQVDRDAAVRGARRLGRHRARARREAACSARTATTTRGTPSCGTSACPSCGR